MSGLTRVIIEVVLDPNNPSVDTIEIEVNPDWAPVGADRFLKLVDEKYYDECRIYRVIPNFICQWGIPKTPDMWQKWGENKIKDDPVKTSNIKGTLSFATSGPNARGSQVFINYDDDCAQLDSQNFAPFAKVVKGMEVAEKLYEEKAVKLDQMKAKAEGNAYFQRSAPNLSFIKTMSRA